MLSRNITALFVSVWISACSRDIATGVRCTDACGTSGAAARADTTFEASGAGGIDSPNVGDRVVATNSPPQRAVPNLSVTLQDMNGSPADELHAACDETCVDITAAVSGGNAPYHYLWDDGSTGAARHACFDTKLDFSVQVSDTAVVAQEFAHPMMTAMAHGSVVRMACPAAEDDAGPATNSSVMCHPDTGPVCDLGSGHSLPEDVTVDVPGATARYFAGGTELPAGHYRLAYVDGCNTYGIGCDWTIHGSKASPGLESCFLVSNDQVLGLTPGTVGVYASDDPTIGGAFATYQECVAANCSDPALDFMFAGGKFGVQRDGGGVLGAIDDAGGESVGGRSPTFRLIRLDPCP